MWLKVKADNFLHFSKDRNFIICVKIGHVSKIRIGVKLKMRVLKHVLNPHYSPKSMKKLYYLYFISIYFMFYLTFHFFAVQATELSYLQNLIILVLGKLLSTVRGKKEKKKAALKKILLLASFFLTTTNFKQHKLK